MYAFGVRLRYANLSNIMLGISNSSSAQKHYSNDDNIAHSSLCNVIVNALSVLNPKQMSNSDVSKQILMICSTVRICVLVTSEEQILTELKSS